MGALLALDPVNQQNDMCPDTGARMQERGVSQFQTQEATVETVTVLTEQPRGFLGPLAIAWLFPATTARRLAHASLLQVWSVHFVAVLLTGVVIVFLVACSDADVGLVDGIIGDRHRTLILEVEKMLGESAGAFQRHPYRQTLTVLGMAVCVEAGFLVTVHGSFP